MKIQRRLFWGFVLIVLFFATQGCCRLFNIDCPPIPPLPNTNLNGFTTDNIKFLALTEELDVCGERTPVECADVTQQLQLLAATDSDKFLEFLKVANICSGEISSDIIAACTEIRNLRLPLSPKPCGPGSCPVDELLELMLIRPGEKIAVTPNPVESNETILEGQASNTFVRDDFYTLEITKGQLNSLPTGPIKLEVIGPNQNYTTIVNSIR